MQLRYVSEGPLLAHRKTKRPLVSVVMSLHNDADTAVRAIESVLNQSFEDLELVIADCASTDRTPLICERFHDRDIRVEYIHLDTDNMAVGAHTALCAVRGSYVLMMRPCDWLGSDLLHELTAFIRANDLQLAIPAQSFDTYTGRNHERSSSVTTFNTMTWKSAADFHQAVGELLMLGVLDDPFGMAIDSEIVRASVLAHMSEKPLDGVIACLERVERAGVLAGHPYHVTKSSPAAPSFDPDRYPSCEREHTELLDLFRSWGFDLDAEEMEPVYRRYLLDIIGCIDNACIGHSPVSSVERTQRVQDMLDDEATQRAVQMMSHAAREFGCMYKPMAKKNAAACCMGSRLREVARISHIPLGPIVR